jgi:hypothetical protein
MEGWPNAVESHLTGILVFEREKRIEILITFPSGEKHKVILEGVDRFFLNGMREKNIIESIRLLGPRETEGDFESAVACLVTGSTNGNFDESFRSVVEDAIVKVRTGEQVLLEIYPIYGVEVMALARSVEFR